MSKRITVRISGRGPDTDAPTVSDLIDQLADYFDLLGEVEEAIAPDGGAAIQWRVVNATKASPLSITVQAFARQYAVNVDRRAEVVVHQVTRGLHSLTRAPQRPAYFSEKALQKAERMFERITNGIDLTEIEIEGAVPDDDTGPIDLTPAVARVAAKNVREILDPVAKPYDEIGAIEGHLQSVSKDGKGRRIVYVKHRLTGDEVKCFVRGQAEAEISHCEVDDIWKGRRLSISGVIHCKGHGRIAYVDADRIRFLRNSRDLPDIGDILDPNFTNGLTSEEYLKKLRNGDHS